MVLTENNPRNKLSLLLKKTAFVITVILLNIFVTNIVWNIKSNKYKIEIKQNYALKKEISSLQQRIQSLNLIISEKQKLINYIESQVGGLTGVITGEKNSFGIGGKETAKFENFIIDNINGNLNERRGLNSSEQVEDKKTIYNYTPTIWPSEGYISSRFGYRISPFTRSQMFHEGLDIAAVTGTKIYAAASGTVIFSGIKPGYGNFIIIQHKYGYSTAYGHCSKLLVTKNMNVKKGDLIGLVGNSGNSYGSHVHYELRINGIPVDPELYMIRRVPQQFNQKAADEF
ncbi:MAG TPA: M23 family metallopeptidase [bacterium]|nr:M23 family metallopeptidase [bacterium]